MKDIFVDLDSFKLPVETQVKVRDILIDMPIKYKCEAINNVFTISLKEAKKIIHCDKLKPIQIFPNRGLLCITILNFYWSPVGKFTELTFSIIAGYNAMFNFPLISIPINVLFRKFGFFPFSVAQSTEIAIEHGNIITGYPHYTKLTTVEFSRNEDIISMEAFTDQEMILQMQIKKSNTEKIHHDVHTTYSLKNNSVSKIKLETYGIKSNATMCNIKLGNQELSNLLRKLRISDKTIFTSYYRDSLKIIHSPIPLG